MRRVVCFFLSHQWVKARYPGADTADGYYLHCQRCRRDNHGTGRSPNGPGGLSFGVGG